MGILLSSALGPLINRQAPLLGSYCEGPGVEWGRGEPNTIVRIVMIIMTRLSSLALVYGVVVETPSLLGTHSFKATGMLASLNQGLITAQCGLGDVDKEPELHQACDVFIPIVPLAYSPLPQIAHKKRSPPWDVRNVLHCDLSGGHTGVYICKNPLSHALKIKDTL